MKKKISMGVLFLFLIMVIAGFLIYFRVIEDKFNIQDEKISEILSEEEKDEPVVVKIPRKENKNIKLTVIGDIMCHNSQYVDAYDSKIGTYDFGYVFEDISDKLRDADITVGNLETTFAGSQRGYSNYPQFNSPEMLGQNLKNVGIDVLSTANNHCMDTGYSGLESTLNFLDEFEISHMGTNRSTEEQNSILIKEVNDIKIAFLSFTYGTNGIAIPASKEYAVNLIDEEFIIAQIALAKKENPDLICVNMHWGIEYQNVQNKTQENLANFLFQNGVDIILGSHPHVLQPMEKKEVTLENGEIKECFVIYSLGNFISGQTKTYTRSSIILNLEIEKSGDTGKIRINDISYVPIYMYKSNSSTKKYRIIDIEKTVQNYESGENISIGQSNYQILKTELDRINKMYENIK